MPRPYRYTINEHKKAFEYWLEKNSIAYAARQMKLAHKLIDEWSSSQYICPLGCPWHGYEKLQESRKEAREKQIRIFEQGLADPELLRQATAESIFDGNKSARNRQAVIDKIQKLIRTDIEVITHWEFLYGKVFFDITGIELQQDELVDLEGNIVNMAEKYGMGMHVDKLEKGIYLLSHIRSKIDELRNRNIKPTTSAEIVSQESTPILSSQDSLEELRRLRMAVESAPTSQVNNILIQLRGATDVDNDIPITGR